jgi:hypothetical protein
MRNSHILLLPLFLAASCMQAPENRSYVYSPATAAPGPEALSQAKSQCLEVASHPSPPTVSGSSIYTMGSSGSKGSSSGNFYACMSEKGWKLAD